MGSGNNGDRLDGIAERIEEHVRAAGEVPANDAQFGRDVDLFELGYVDSVGFVSLITWLEETYSIELTEAYLFDERFSSISGIAGIVSSRVDAGTEP
jgi:methoxymalonate biosynthesis acyl carrier protein